MYQNIDGVHARVGRARSVLESANTSHVITHLVELPRACRVPRPTTMRIVTFIILSITQQGDSLTRKHTSMSNSTTGVPGLYCCCPDIPLSTTGNTITLLTFVGG